MRPVFDSRLEQGFIYSQPCSIGCEIHPASNPVSKALFSGVKRPEREADRSLPTSTEVKNVWIYPSTPPYFMTWCLSNENLPLHCIVVVKKLVQIQRRTISVYLPSSVIPFVPLLYFLFLH
jgi:hypothetical protein